MIKVVIIKLPPPPNLKKNKQITPQPTKKGEKAITTTHQQQMIEYVNLPIQVQIALILLMV